MDSARLQLLLLFGLAAELFGISGAIAFTQGAEHVPSWLTGLDGAVVVALYGHGNFVTHLASVAGQVLAGTATPPPTNPSTTDPPTKTSPAGGTAAAAGEAPATW